ncbi:hypothetical protein Agub_g11644, partial [Astrephomene gubernaculifera]
MLNQPAQNDRITFVSEFNSNHVRLKILSNVSATRTLAGGLPSPPKTAPNSASETLRGRCVCGARLHRSSATSDSRRRAPVGKKSTVDSHRHPHVHHPQPLFTQPPDPCQLLHGITSSPDLYSLLDLLHHSEPYLNLRHLDAALNRLARFTSATHNDTPPTSPSSPIHTSSSSSSARATALRLLSLILPAHAASLSPRDAASLLSSLSRLHLPPPAPLAALLTSSLLSQLPAASLRDRVALLHAAAALRLVLPAGAVGALLGSMEGELGRLGKPQDVSMALWALARLGFRPPARWLSRLLARLPPHRLADWGPQALANTAWALAKMGWAPGAGARWAM